MPRSNYTIGAPGCCSTQPIDVDFDLDLPIALQVAEHAVTAMVDEGILMGIQLPATGTLLTWSLHSSEIAELLGDDVTAWVVQRPGCAGLVTRVIVLDAGNRVVAAIAPSRRVAAPEPASWRVHLLLGLAKVAA